MYYSNKVPHTYILIMNLSLLSPIIKFPAIPSKVINVYIILRLIFVLLTFFTKITERNRSKRKL